MNKIKELENKMAELSKELEKLKSKQTNDWTLEESEEYWFISDAGFVVYCQWGDSYADNFRKDYLKIFRTEAEAKEYINYIKAKKEYSHEFTQEDWKNNDLFKYFIIYDFDTQEFIIDWILRCKEIGTTYFRTEEACKEFIDKYSKEIKKYDIGIKEE